MGEVFENDLNFDNYGNVDYTGILLSDIFVTLELQRLRQRAVSIGRKFKKTRVSEDETLEQIEQMLSGDANHSGQADQEEQMKKATDNRKVVVEDLVYIDDLQVLIYTTVAPKTS